MININFIAISLLAMLICSCNSDGSSDSDPNAANQDPVAPVPSEFESKLIQRSEVHEKDAGQIRNRIEHASDDPNTKTIDGAEPGRP
jgi:hypothetical protein